MSKFLFISIKPEYANKIISKEKTCELRKHRPNVKSGDYVIIYATVPVKAVIGFGKIKAIIETTPTNMWNENSDKLGIKKDAFDKYYKDTNRAIGIELSSICKFEFGFLLTKIKELYPSFSPPQTYRYISNFRALRTYKALVLSCYCKG
jgi:predicted transcriptional regulator